ncbi:MAG: EAL domain-containing protein [Planctomycetaceae bacterium]|nr:EAL domain-containing protein [Planctomycetaceae bacterium]
MTTLASSNTVSLGRQPILDAKQQVIGYELLCRDAATDMAAANRLKGDAGATDVLVSALVEIGLDSVVGDRLAFVNFSKPFLDGTTDIPHQADQLVVEVPPSVEIDEAVASGIRKLSEQGYRIALSDFVYSPRWDPLLPYADIIKLDVTKLTEKQLRAHVQLLNDNDIAALAVNVETHEQYEMCSELGCALLQGHFFSQPNVVDGKVVRTSYSALIQTLAAVNTLEAGPDEIEAAVSQDPALAHKLMKFVNSSAYGRRSPVDSVQQAIVYLGKETVRRMVNLLLMTSVNDKPTVLTRTALVRATACKNLAHAMGEPNQDAFFTVGLLSLIDAMLDRPLDGIVQELPVTDAFKEALLEHRGAMGACLDAVIAFELNEPLAPDNLPLMVSDQCKAYLDAVTSVEQNEGMASMLPSSGRRIDEAAFRGSAYSKQLAAATAEA